MPGCDIKVSKPLSWKQNMESKSVGTRVFKVESVFGL